MIRHLPYFAVVAEEEHFQRAADRLNITQSALSRRIQLLEEELGVLLFERLARGVRLTAAGESFHRDVRKVQADLEAAKERARGIMTGLSGQITVAVNPSGVNNPVVRRVFAALRERHPDIQVHMKMIYSEEQIGALHENAVDVGILYKFSEEKGLTYAPMDIDRLVLAMPADHPLATKPSLRLEDLRDMPFIWPTRAHSPRLFDQLIGVFQSRGFSPSIGVEVHSTESVLAIVAMGQSVGFITPNLASMAPPTVTIRTIADFSIDLPICAAWRTDSRQPFLAQFSQTLASVVAEAAA